MIDKWNFIGSKWLKFDFHTHTPNSKDYGRSDESLKNVTPEEWIQKSMEAGLDCVVITDHNSGGWIDVLKAKNKELQDCVKKPVWYKELVIFPGVEITVADSSSRVHLLAVFDPDCDSQKVTGVLGACGITSNHGDPNISTSTGFTDTVKHIIEAGGIPIPAHIDGKQGLLEDIHSLSPELEKSLKSVLAAEFCDINKFDNVHPPLKKEIDRLARVAGSDSHKPDDIGRHFSWLKMSKPTIENLRLALQDHEFCVKNQSENPNRLPDIFLFKLSINAMRHCGRVANQPFAIQLHPHFNSVIGGRGAGKSTILESIRIVSRRVHNLETEAPKLKNELDKFMALSQHTGVMLDNTEIVLGIQRRGKKYQLRWKFGGQGELSAEGEIEDWQKVDDDEVIERFPISIFSQKQINELASNPRGLLAVIDRSSEVNLAEWKSRWENVKSNFFQLRERRRQLWRQLSGEQQIRSKLQDVINDLTQYEEKGHGKILKQYQLRSQQKKSLASDQTFDDLSSDIRKLASRVALPNLSLHLFDDQDEITTEIKAIHEKTAEDLKKVSRTLNELADWVDSLKSKMIQEIASSKWQQAVQASITAYADLIKEYEGKKSQLSMSLYGEWVQQRNQLEQQLKELDSVRKEIELTDIQIDQALEKFRELRLELFEKRKAFLDKTVGANNFVRMELVQYGDISTLEEEYRSLLSLEAGKFISSVCDRENNQGILWKLNCWEAAKIPESELPELISQIKIDTLNIAKGKYSAIHGAFDNRLKKLLITQPDIFDHLEAWWPEDLLRVKYSKDPSSGKFEDLEKGSAGQKAAAILAFLLSHGDEPLIIDQPEDDLDNALIYDLIVKQIHDNKNRRQLIIVTHNPNIVVNGDSELVHILKYERGQVQIQLQGGLGERKIREAICAIMEGGRQAFIKRYNRIALEI